MADKAPEYRPISKMNVKAIGGQPHDVLKDKTKPVFCGRFFGICNGVKTKELANHSMMTVFLGAFRAEGPEGELFESNRLNLPGSLADQMEAAVRANAPAATDFAFDVFANFNDKSPVKYDYAIRAIVKTQAENRLEELTERISEAVKGKKLPSTQDVKALPAAEGEASAKKGKKDKAA